MLGVILDARNIEGNKADNFLPNLLTFCFRYTDNVLTMYWFLRAAVTKCHKLGDLK